MCIFYQAYRFFDTNISSLISQNELFAIRQSVSNEFKTHPQNTAPQFVGDGSLLLPTKYIEDIIDKISYSHFTALIKIQDEHKRY
jgi:Ca2+-binding EF-hand superfamily protein